MPRPSIQEAAQDLARAWETSERERAVLFSMLDDSDDESQLVRDAESIRTRLKPEVEAATSNKGPITGALRRLPRSPNNPTIQRSNVLAEKAKDLSEKYKGKTQHRISGAQRSAVIKYSLNTTGKDGSSREPKFTWKICFKKLVLPIVDSGDMWQDLSYNQESFEEWWKLKPLEPFAVSHGWSDMKRLGRRVVIQILEFVQSQDLEFFKHIRQLKMLAEICREIVLYQMILCHSTLLKDVKYLQDIFEYTAPIIYLFCGIVRSASDLAPSDILETQAIKTHIGLLEPFFRELRERCYLVGARIGFDIEEFREEFNKGRIFDFDQDPGVKTGFISVNPFIAGKTQAELLNRVDNIGQKQVLVNSISPSRSTRKDLSREKIEILDEKVLELIGIKKITDIKDGSGTFLGSGAYATVVRMERIEGSGPVAVKQYRMKPRTAKRIEREARVWAGIKHENIAPLLGFTYLPSGSGNQPCLVSEAYHCDLKRLIHDYEGGREVDGRKLTEERKVAFIQQLRDVILALEFLHASGIAHGDLRAANILVTNELFDDPSCYAVLNDFGMAENYGEDISTVLDHRDLSSVNQCTSDHWVAPELLETAPRGGSLARVSKEGDIYAFGVVFLEVIYEMDPYSKSNLVARYAKANGIPPAEKTDLDLLSESHWTLMQGCWETPDKRLDINKVAWAILDIHKKLIPPTPTGPDDPGMAYWSKFMKERGM